MSYDKWKTSNPQDDGWTADEVVACCGMDAFDAVESRLIDDEIIEVCIHCGEAWPNNIDRWEYEEIQRDNAQEYNRDED
tara:strand:+ start:119 stop:355 length:237 start_codon:yes stop_codon:yes gene_type:complete